MHLMLLGHVGIVTAIPFVILSFLTTESGGNTTSASVDLPDFDDFDLDSNVEIISDERGVRIAREEGD